LRSLAAVDGSQRNMLDSLTAAPCVRTRVSPLRADEDFDRLASCTRSAARVAEKRYPSLARVMNARTSSL
jgi:hypothetical protein